MGETQHFSGVMETLENYRVVVFTQYSIAILKPTKLYNLSFSDYSSMWGVDMLVEVRGQLVGVISLLPLWESQGLNLGHQTWQQGP